MPQMAPLSWTMLFIMFSASLMIFSMMNFYSFQMMPMKSATKSQKNHKTMNWKW